jgi:hypothetical protein
VLPSLKSGATFIHAPRSTHIPPDVHDNSAADLDLSSGLDRAPLYARNLWSFVFRHEEADLDLSSGLERAPLYARGEFYR